MKNLPIGIQVFGDLIGEGKKWGQARLLSFLFDRQEIEDRLKKYTGSNKEIHTLYEKSLETIGNICDQLRGKGIEISDIILKIIGAVKNPRGHGKPSSEWQTRSFPVSSSYYQGTKNKSRSRRCLFSLRSFALFAAD